VGQFIHGVIPIPTRRPEAPTIEPAETIPKNRGPADPFQVKPLEDLEPTPPPAKPDKPLTPQQAFLLQRQMIQKATAYKIFLAGNEPDEEGEK